MSRVRRKPQKISRSRREKVARKISTEFNKLDPASKRKFADDTLTQLVNMTKRQMRKLFEKFMKKGKPSTKDLETINQLIVVFLYSVKEEFRYHYASMIYKGLNMALPEDLPEKLEAVRKLEWIHAGVEPELYSKLYHKWREYGVENFNDFFNHLLSDMG